MPIERTYINQKGKLENLPEGQITIDELMVEARQNGSGDKLTDQSIGEAALALSVEKPAEEEGP